jgi:hypothetical protein
MKCRQPQRRSIRSSLPTRPSPAMSSRRIASSAGFALHAHSSSMISSLHGRSKQRIAEPPLCPWHVTFLLAESDQPATPTRQGSSQPMVIWPSCSPPPPHPRSLQPSSCISAACPAHTSWPYSSEFRNLFSRCGSCGLVKKSDVFGTHTCRPSQALYPVVYDNRLSIRTGRDGWLILFHMLTC